jgi:hypothetical protein
MSQHVRVNLEAKPSFDSGALDHLGKARLRKQRAALGQEHEVAMRSFPAQPPKSPHLIALQQVRGRIALLGPAHVKPMAIEINLIPLQIDKLDRAEAVAVRHQDHRRVAMSPAVFLPTSEGANARDCAVHGSVTAPPSFFATAAGGWPGVVNAGMLLPGGTKKKNARRRFRSSSTR